MHYIPKKKKKPTKSGNLSPRGERRCGAWAHSQKDSHSHKWNMSNHSPKRDMVTSSQGCCISISWPNYMTREIPHKEAIGHNLWRAWTTILLWPTSKAKNNGEVPH